MNRSGMVHVRTSSRCARRTPPGPPPRAPPRVTNCLYEPQWHGARTNLFSMRTSYTAWSASSCTPAGDVSAPPSSSFSSRSPRVWALRACGSAAQSPSSSVGNTLDPSTCAPCTPRQAPETLTANYETPPRIASVAYLEEVLGSAAAGVDGPRPRVVLAQLQPGEPAHVVVVHFHHLRRRAAW
jgi:hypothetical protein